MAGTLREDGFRSILAEESVDQDAAGRAYLLNHSIVRFHA